MAPALIIPSQICSNHFPRGYDLHPLLPPHSHPSPLVPKPPSPLLSCTFLDLLHLLFFAFLNSKKILTVDSLPFASPSPFRSVCPYQVSEQEASNLQLVLKPQNGPLGKSAILPILTLLSRKKQNVAGGERDWDEGARLIEAIGRWNCLTRRGGGDSGALLFVSFVCIKGLFIWWWRLTKADCSQFVLNKVLYMRDHCVCVLLGAKVIMYAKWTQLGNEDFTTHSNWTKLSYPHALTLNSIEYITWS